MASAPELITAAATVPAAIAPVTLRPAAAEPVLASTWKLGLVVPFGPTARAVEALSVIVTVSAKRMAPVEVPANWTVPEPLASMVRFSLAPELVAATATPPAAAAPVTPIPVAADPVLASTLSTGLVAPFGPTAKALALLELIVAGLVRAYWFVRIVTISRTQ